MEDIFKLIRGIKDLPPAPQVLPKILEALHSETTTLEEVGELIALEPALTAKLLRYCNSAYFGGSEPVASVPEAIGRVGFETVFALVSAATGNQAFKMPPNSGVDAAQLWKHSVTTAFSCKFIAQDLDLNTNLHFTAGMLHDIGRVILANAKGAQYGQLLAEAQAKQISSSEAEKTAYGFTHAEVGGCLMTIWKLPPILGESIRYHHRPASAGPARKSAACVCVGNELSHLFEHPTEGLDANNLELQNAMALLGIGPKQIEFYESELQDSWDFVNELIELR